MSCAERLLLFLKLGAEWPLVLGQRLKQRLCGVRYSPTWRLAYCDVACRRETGSVQLRSLVVLKYSSSPDAADAGQLLSQLPEHLKAK